MLIVSEFFFGLLLILTLIFFNVPLILSSIFFIAYLLIPTLIHGFTLTINIILALSVVTLLLLNVRVLRRWVITNNLFKKVKQKLPPISSTEREVLEAGNVWWEQQLFAGRPNWKHFLNFKTAALTEEEQAFLANEVEILCDKLKDWEIINDRDLSEDAWNYIKKEKFLGLGLPKKYGGKGFSAFAQSTIIMKIASRSYSAAVDIMVPNSVGVAEFILYYGTKEQKETYLPKFAVGEEIPCFALTAPEAGSDAGSMPDQGIVCWDEYEGQKVLGVKLNWDKRYITLAPVATLIGLAFKLYDPDKLLGEKTELGITLAMIPRDTKGVEIGNRHCPLLMAFLNGPIRGKDVFIPLDFLIGGKEASGKGWSMMMECLSVGRGISLPALSTATAKLSYRMTGAYAKLREQFRTPIGEFEGIQEAMARISAFTYICEATRCLTAAAIDEGIKPSIATAITKYHLTELSRKLVNDAMDIHGGRLVQLGPSNYLGLYYIAQPISITVEGANILTRNMIIFGQGALRCHPYIRQEVAALEIPNKRKAIKKFDRLFFKHIGYIFSNTLRCLFHSLTAGRLIPVPVNDYTAKYYQQLTRMSVALALVTDMSLGVLGGKLKQRERLSARLGDVLSYLYLATAVLKYYQDHDRPIADLPFIDWIMNYYLYHIAAAFEQFLVNFPNRPLAALVRAFIFPWGNNFHLPLDRQDHLLAESMMMGTEQRNRLTNYLYLGNEEDITHKMNAAFEARLNAEGAYQKLQAAVRAGNIKEKSLYLQILAAKTANILTDQEINQLLEFDHLRLEVIQVDEFIGHTRDENYARESHQRSLHRGWNTDPFSKGS